MHSLNILFVKNCHNELKFKTISFVLFYIELTLFKIITQEIQESPQTATVWENQRKKALKLLSQNGYPNNMIDIKFYKTQEEPTILKDLRNWGIAISPNINYKKFPAARIMAFSQFHRVHSTKKIIKTQ